MITLTLQLAFWFALYWLLDWRGRLAEREEVRARATFIRRWNELLDENRKLIAAARALLTKQDVIEHELYHARALMEVIVDAVHQSRVDGQPVSVEGAWVLQAQRWQQHSRHILGDSLDAYRRVQRAVAEQRKNADG